MHLEQLQRYDKLLGMVAWPQVGQRNHSPSALAFMSLKLRSSTQ